MIIDHETMTEMGPTDETMELRAIVPVVPLAPGVEANSGGNGGEYKPWPIPPEDDEVVPAPVVDYAKLEKKVPTLAEWAQRKYPERWAEMHRNWSYQFVPLPRRENTHGNPAPLLRDSVTGRLSMARFAAEAPIEDVVAAVKELCENPVGVERESSEDTATFALPAVEKMTGSPTTNALAHRSAASVQRIWNEAGWPIAVWFGEYTRTFWVLDENGLHEFETITAMYQGMGWESL